MEGGGDDGGYFFLEVGPGELQGVLAEGLGREIVLGEGFEVGEGLLEGVGGVIVEEEAGGVGEDGFGGAALVVGDDGGAGGLGFEGGEAEVFFAGEEEGAGGLVVLEEDVVGEVSEELDVGGVFGEGAEFFLFGALADDEEFSW